MYLQYIQCICMYATVYYSGDREIQQCIHYKQCISCRIKKLLNYEVYIVQSAMMTVSQNVVRLERR